MNATTKVIMENKLYFPTVCCGVGKGQGCKTLEIEVKLTTKMCTDWDTMERKEMYVFTACGHGMGRCGQCLDTFKDKAVQYIMPQEKQELFNRVFEIWNKYHLNDMQSGTRKQTLRLLHADPTLHYATNYSDACRHLKNQDLLYHNGYKYGSNWLCKPIPENVVEEILSWGKIEQEPREVIETMRKQLYREYRKGMV